MSSWKVIEIIDLGDSGSTFSNNPGSYPSFADVTTALLPTSIEAVQAAFNAEASARWGMGPFDLTEAVHSDPYIFYNLSDHTTMCWYTLQAGGQVKRVQHYDVKIENIPQNLCSLKETAFTKISGFRKYTL